MAGRIRTIKPEILSDAKAARLSDRAWRLWIGMWTLADDVGLVPADVDYLSAQVLWGQRNRDAHQARVELVTAGFISLYEINGETYAKINGWQKHQRIDKPGPNRFPLPPEDSATAREDSRKLANIRERSTRDQDLDQDQEGTKTNIPGPSDAGEFDFDSVYAKYPRKEGKKKGKARFKSQITTRLKYDALMRAIENYVAIADPAYLKHFDTFMGCWEDYVDAGLLTPRRPRPSNAPLEPCPAETESRTEPLP